MGAIASQIRLSIFYLKVYSGADQRKHESSASLAFVPGEFPAQMASNAENVSIWWRHHGDETFQLYWNIDCRRGYPLHGISCLMSLRNHMRKVISSKYYLKGRCGDYYHLS